MPTAVMIESSENTMSMTMICTMTRAERGAHRRDASLPRLALEELVDLAVLL